MELPPLRMLLMGDFSGAGSAAACRPLALDRDNLEQTLGRLRRDLTLEVENFLGGKDRTRFFRLSLAGPADFTPEALVAGSPELSRIQALRAALGRSLAGKGPAGELEQAARACGDLEALQQAVALVHQDLAGSPGSGAAEGAASGAGASGGSGPGASGSGGGDGDALSRILSMVDTAPRTPEQQKGAASAAVGALVSGLVGGQMKRSAGAGSAALRQALEQVEGVLGRQIGAILHAPAFQQVEASFHGLRELVRACNFRRGIQLEVLDVTRADLVEAFRAQVHEVEMSGYSQVSPSLVVLDYPLHNLDSELGQLQELAELAAEIPVPLLTSVNLDFFGLKEPAALNRIRFLGNLLQEPQYTRYNALRDKECSRWLAVAVGRYLAREPYKERTRGSLEMVEEVRDSEERLWGNPAWLVARLVARSHADVGWPTEITGLESGLIEDLPIFPFQGPMGREMHIPTEAFISQQLGEDMAQAGLIAMTCQPEADMAFVFRAPILHPPGRFTEPGATEGARVRATLPYQLLAARLADVVGRHKAALTGGKAPQEVEHGLHAFLNGLMAGTGPGAGARVELERAGHRFVAHLTLRTGRKVLGGVGVNFSIPI